jgi:hypothetical protein
VLIVHDLEGQGGERGVVGGLPLLHLAGLRIDALHGRDVEGRGQIVDHGVQEGLHPFVLEGSPAQHGEQGHGDGALADGRP